MPKPVRGSSIARAFAIATVAAAFTITIPASFSDDDGDSNSGSDHQDDEDVEDIDNSGPDEPDAFDDSGGADSSGPDDADAADTSGSDSSGPSSEIDSSESNSGPGSTDSKGGRSGGGSSNSGPGSNHGPSSNSGPGNADSRANPGDPIVVELDDDGERIRAHSLLLIEQSQLGTGTPELGHATKAETIELAALGLRVTRLALSVRLDTSDTLGELRAGNAGGTFAYENLYSLAGTTSANRSPAATTARPVPRSAMVPVGLIDTEIELGHRSLSSAQIVWQTFHGGLPDRSAHGTAVASLMVDAAAGAPAQRQKLYAADVFEQSAEGDTVASGVSVAQALDWLCRQKIRVANLSLEGQPNPLLELAISAAQKCGISIVAAAGNNGPASAPRYPAAYPGVIAVTAVDGNGAVWRRANQGSHIAFAAQGVNVSAADRFGTTAKFSGTSYAAPAVAMALAETLARIPNGGDALSELSRRAKDLGEPGRDDVYGFGVIDGSRPIKCAAPAKDC